MSDHDDHQGLSWELMAVNLAILAPGLGETRNVGSTGMAGRSDGDRLAVCGKVEGASR